MMNYLFPRLLDDPAEYARAVTYWTDLWSRLDPAVRKLQGWRHPWLAAEASDLLDANPIFTAVSDTHRRGIRVIQSPPTGSDSEFTSWIDTFGGTLTDPESIIELVISCVLSTATSARAFELMSEWISGGSLHSKTELLTLVAVPAIQRLAA